MGLLNKIFPKKSKEPFDFSYLKTDVHSHLIPGIDDGSQSMEETISLLEKMIELGYERVITTPHIMSDYYPNTPETILAGLEDVRKEIKRLNLKIEIDAAAEYYYDEYFFDKIKNKSLLTFNGNHVLFEFSFSSKPNNIKALIFELRSNNYQPVLAHFERYPYFFDDITYARTLREQGVKIQVNLSSITGHYGKPIMKQAQKLIDEKLVDLVGTDCHRMQHLQILEGSATNTYFHKLKELDLINLKIG
jgi:tyrosine-protein phosphatase YwqE